MCPHTATCFKAYDTCREDKSIKTIAYSTAEWTKFSPVVAYAITGEKYENDQQALKMIAEKAQVSMPKQIAQLFDKPIAQKTVIKKQDIEQEILAFLK